MRTIRLLITGALCLLFFTGSVKAQDMQKKISLNIEKASLSDVLNQLKEQYGLRFSYLNNDLSADTVYNVQVQDAPLSEVLDKLLEKSESGYQYHNGQIIIRKGLQKPAPAKRTEKEKKSVVAPAPKGEEEVASSAIQIKAGASPPEKEAEPPVQEEQVLRARIPTETEVEKKGPENSSEVSEGAKEAVNREEAEPATKEEEKAKAPFWQKWSLKSELNPDAPVSPYHFGIIYPLSTHGTKAPQYINKISLHLLTGTASGLDGVEFSGVGNIENDFVEGFQAAGVFNFVRNEVNGVQSAGVVNINGGKLEGAQLGGFANLNLNSVKGLQAAGFMNVADSVDGAQLAGFLNTAGDVKGVQVSGFLNKARNVKGVQAGIINVADSFSGGVPIGLLSFVKNGYRAFEVYAGEDFEANINFKIGVRKFYNILALGAELNGNKRSGYGYGIGSEFVSGRRFSMGADAVSYYVNETSYAKFPDGIFEETSVNILNKLRLTAGFNISRRLAIFGGPTYNVFVSRYQESPEGPIGSELVKNTFFDRTNRNTNVKMWIGFNAGIRF